MKKLYLVTDNQTYQNNDLLSIIEESVLGGVDLVQLREKNLSTRDFVEKAIRIKRLLIAYRIPLIINDRIDVALASGADGIHIGQSDMPYSYARKIMGKDAIIGLSIETKEQLLESENLDVDYIGISPVFFTNTKSDIAKPWGFDGLQFAKKHSKHKIVAIGGINETNATKTVQAGADMIAVVSAICMSLDPKRAAQNLKERINL